MDGKKCFYAVLRSDVVGVCVTGYWTTICYLYWTVSQVLIAVHLVRPSTWTAFKSLDQSPIPYYITEPSTDLTRSNILVEHTKCNVACKLEIINFNNWTKDERIFFSSHIPSFIYIHKTPFVYSHKRFVDAICRYMRNEWVFFSCSGKLYVLYFFVAVYLYIYLAWTINQMEFQWENSESKKKNGNKRDKRKKCHFFGWKRNTVDDNIISFLKYEIYIIYQIATYKNTLYMKWENSH